MNDPRTHTLTPTQVQRDFEEKYRRIARPPQRLGIKARLAISAAKAAANNTAIQGSINFVKSLNSALSK